MLFDCLLFLKGRLLWDDACHDDDNHEWNRGHDHGLEGDALLHGVTLSQHRHISVSSSPIPNSW
jgi:hypothetical protein